MKLYEQYLRMIIKNLHKGTNMIQKTITPELLAKERIKYQAVLKSHGGLEGIKRETLQNFKNHPEWNTLTKNEQGKAITGLIKMLDRNHKFLTGGK